MDQVSARHLAQIINRLFTSTLPAILPAPLHYRNLQRCRASILVSQSNRYDATAHLPQAAKDELRWWMENIHLANGKAILCPKANLIIESDASRLGWGAFLRNSGEITGGHWAKEEVKFHINWLELKAGFLAIQTFTTGQTNIHVLMYMDNRVAIAYLNKMGGVASQVLCKLAIEIWEWCLGRNITMHAEHLPGVMNTRADTASRNWSDSGNWKLCPKIFQKLNTFFGSFSIDLFASFRNNQQRFYSWKPDPQALALDALSQSWVGETAYAFPPLIGRCLQKINQKGLEFLLLIAPIWRAQHWYPFLTNAEGQPNSPSKQTTDPRQYSGRVSPTDSEWSHDFSSMASLRNSGDYHEKLKTSSKHHGTAKSYDSAWKLWDGWCCERGLDPFSASVKEVIEFLTDQFCSGKEYSTINSYRSAISASHVLVDKIAIGKHALVCRFIQGIFNSRPPQPRYQYICDIQMVLSLLRSWGETESLTLKNLSAKLVILMALCNADRSSELNALDLRFRRYLPDGVQFVLPTRQSGPPKEVTYPMFTLPCPNIEGI